MTEERSISFVIAGAKLLDDGLLWGIATAALVEAHMTNQLTIIAEEQPDEYYQGWSAQTQWPKDGR